MEGEEKLCEGDVVTEVNLKVSDYDVINSLRNMLDESEITEDVFDLAVEYIKGTLEDEYYIEDLLQETIDGILENTIGEIIDTVDISNGFD